MQVTLPEDVETRLNLLSKKTGRSKDSYICEALEFYLEDLGDYAIALERLGSPGQRLSHEEVKKRLGLHVED